MGREDLVGPGGTRGGLGGFGVGGALGLEVKERPDSHARFNPREVKE